MTLLVVVEVLGLAGCLLLGCAKSPGASGDPGALQGSGKGLTVDGSTLSIHSPGTKEPLRFVRETP